MFKVPSLNRGRVLIFIIALLTVFLFSSTDVLAAGDKWYDYDGLHGLNAVLGGIGQAVSNFLKVILVLGAGGAAVFAVIEIMNGDQASAKRFFVWFAGTVLGFIILSVLDRMGFAVMPGSKAPDGFSPYYDGLKMLMRTALLIVMSVTCIQKIIMVVNGEKEGSRNLFKWFVVSLIGLVLISAVNIGG